MQKIKKDFNDYKLQLNTIQILQKESNKKVEKNFTIFGLSSSKVGKTTLFKKLTQKLIKNENDEENLEGNKEEKDPNESIKKLVDIFSYKIKQQISVRFVDFPQFYVNQMIPNEKFFEDEIGFILIFNINDKKSFESLVAKVKGALFFDKLIEPEILNNINKDQTSKNEPLEQIDSSRSEKTFGNIKRAQKLVLIGIDNVNNNFIFFFF